MRIKLLAAAVALAAMLVGIPSAGAITYGEPDVDPAHENVGALIAEWDPDNPGPEHLCSGTLIDEDVFLTAQHCTAYLESIGVAPDDVWVSFAPDVDPVDRKSLRAGTYYDHPDAWKNLADPADLAVVVLDRPVKGIEPASLPRLGLFDQMAKKNGLKGQKFTAVGYGVHEPDVVSGTFPYDGERWRSVSEFNALNDAWLRLSQNDATSDGGTCYGDSGGPNFLGTGDATIPGVVASITVTGDAMCLATNDTYRLDTKTAHDFIGPFLD